MHETNVFSHLKKEIKDIMIKGIDAALESDSSWTKLLLRGGIRWEASGKKCQDEELKKAGCKFTTEGRSICWDGPENSNLIFLGAYLDDAYYVLCLENERCLIVAVNEEAKSNPRVKIVKLENFPNRVRAQIVMDMLKQSQMHMLLGLTDNKINR